MPGIGVDLLLIPPIRAEFILINLLHPCSIAFGCVEASTIVPPKSDPVVSLYPKYDLNISISGILKSTVPPVSLATLINTFLLTKLIGLPLYEILPAVSCASI